MDARNWKSMSGFPYFGTLPYGPPERGYIRLIQEWEKKADLLCDLIFRVQGPARLLLDMLFVVLFLPTPNKPHGFLQCPNSQEPVLGSRARANSLGRMEFGVGLGMGVGVYGFEFGTGLLGFRARVEATQSISFFRYSLEYLETAVEVGVC